MKCKDGGDCGIGGFCKECPALGASELKGVVSCGWTLDHDEFAWDTGCGHLFILNDGTPKENEMVYCPFCGNKISS